MSAPHETWTGGAKIEGDYRYSLWRDWHTPMELDTKIRHGAAVDYVLWLMLNPSTAADRNPLTGQLIDDPTLRRCGGFTERLGFRRLFIANLYALRSANPTALKGHSDPVGPKNDHYVAELAKNAAVVVVGWGSFEPKLLASRIGAVCAMLAGHTLICFGTTQDGAPRHPLFLANDTQPEAWPVVVPGVSP